MSKVNHNYRVMFLRNQQGHPVGCLAISLNRLTNTAEYQYSVLNPQDRFDRKVARQLALGRLVENPLGVSVPRNATMHDVSRAVLSSLALNKHAPSRAIKGAKLWLKSSEPKTKASYLAQVIENF